MPCIFKIFLKGLLFCLVAQPIVNTQAFALDKKASAVLSEYIMANIYDREGNTDLAAQAYKKALNIDYRNSYLHLGLAIHYLRRNEVPQAQEELNLAVKFEPQAVEPHVVLTALYYSQNKINEANRELEIALNNAALAEPENVAIYKTLGGMYIEQKKFSAAEKTYLLVLKLAPDDSEAHFYLGVVHYELKEKEKSISELKKALELKPDYHQALNYLGYFYVEENKNLEEAERLISKAMELDPDNGAYIDSLGWLHFKKGKVKEALKELERASSLIEDPVIYDHLGDAYFKLRDFEKAKFSWQKSLKLEPEKKEVKEKLDKLNK